MDVKEARSVAAGGVKLAGTAGMQIEAYLRRYLDMDEVEAVLQDLVQALWNSPAVVVKILRLARERKT